MPTNYVLIDYENVQPKDLALLKDGSYKVKVFLGATQTKIPTALATALQPLGDGVEYVLLDSSGSNALDFHIAYFIGALSSKDPGATFHVISKDRGFDPLLKYVSKHGIHAQRSASLAEIRRVKLQADTRVAAPPLPSANAPRTKPTASPAAAKIAKPLKPQPVAAAASKPAQQPTQPRIAAPAPLSGRVVATPPPVVAIDAQRLNLAIEDLRKRKAAKPRTKKTLLNTLNALFKKELDPAQLETLIEALRKKGVVIVDGAKVSYNLPG